MKKTKNYINFKGEYVNIENKTLTEIYNDGKLEGLIEGIKKQTELIKVVDAMARRIADYACIECEEKADCSDCKEKAVRDIVATFMRTVRKETENDE